MFYMSLPQRLTIAAVLAACAVAVSLWAGT